MVNLQEIFTRCSGRNANLEYFDKIWLLLKYFLLSWCNADVTLCCEYKLACCNLCWQLLNSCLALTVNLFWLTETDDKLLKFYHCNHTKNAQNDHICTFQQDSRPAYTTCKMVEFLDREMPDFMFPCCLVLIRWTFFISEPDKVYHRGMVATDSISTHTSKLVLAIRYDVSIRSRLAKNI